MLSAIIHRSMCVRGNQNGGVECNILAYFGYFYVNPLAHLPYLVHHMHATRLRVGEEERRHSAVSRYYSFIPTLKDSRGLLG
jgi:hypothetical protein